MSAPFTLAGGTYLFVVLHLIFLLVLLEQHVAALGLLLSFFSTLFAPVPRRLLPRLPQSTQSKLTSPLVEDLSQHGENSCNEASLSSKVKKHREEGEPMVHTLATAGMRHHRNLSLPESLQMPAQGAATTLHGSTSRKRQPALAHQHLEKQEAEEVVAVPTKDIGGSGFPDASEGSGSAANMQEEIRVDTVQGPSHRRTWWVWATAVVSLFSVCVSIALLLVITRFSSPSTASTRCRAPSWACRTLQRTLLSLVAGIRIEEDGVRMRDLFFTIISLSTVGALSVGQAFYGSLLQRRRHTDSSTNCQLERILNRISDWLVKSFTFAPLSLLWTFAAGIDQGTVFGFTYVLLTVLVLVHYPRCVLSLRRWCWLLYVTLLLLLWTVQACFRLPWVRESLEAYAATLSPTRRRLLTVWGLSPVMTTATTALRWQVGQAIGVWWAGVECFCFHTSTYAASVEAPRWTRFCEAAQYRVLYRQALDIKEAKQRACALEQRQAAQQKVEQLRLQRASGAVDVSGSVKGRRQAAASNCDAASLRGSPPSGSENNIFIFEGNAFDRRHAPFGSSESHRCSINGGSFTARSTQVVHGGENEPSAAPVRPLDSWSLARGSFMNSSRSSRFEVEKQLSVHTPLLSHKPSFTKKLGQCASWHHLNGRISSCFRDGGNLTEKVGSVCLSATTATLTLVDSDVADAPPSPPRPWAHEPTKSPTRTVSEGGENADAFLELLNRSPFSSSLPPNCMAAAAAAPSLPGDGSATPILRLCDISASSHSFRVDPCLQDGTHHAPRSGPHPQSVASVTVYGGSPLERDVGWFALDSPPAVDITAMMPNAAVEAQVHAADPQRAAQRLAFTPIASHVEGSEADRGGQESELSRVCCLWRAASRVYEILRKELLAYLRAHTLIVVRKEEQLDAGLTTENTKKRQDISMDDSFTRVPVEMHESSFSPLLMCYASQHWVWVCALLSLLRFTISSTAVNLVPSLASLVYAALPRPWPPRCYARWEVIFAAASVLGKCLLRAILVSGIAPTVSLTKARSLNALLLSIRISSSSPSPVSSSSSTVTVSLSSWECWFDIVMSVAVLCAAVIQWWLLYSDQHVLGYGGDRVSHDRNDSVGAEWPHTLPSPSFSPACSPPHRHTAAQSVEGVQQNSGQGSAGRLTRWNRRRRGAGADYYTIQFFFDFLSVALFCWAYYDIAPEGAAPSQGNVFTAVQHNRLPGTFVATALGLVVVLFAERIIYVLNALVAKYVLHVLLALTCHTLYLVRYATRGINGSSSTATTPIAFLMASRLASLWCGALQLRHGYPLHRVHDPFTTKADVVHWFGHMAFRAVPFLLELRVLLDWSFSATTLKVQHWMLLEDVHHNVYRRYVDMHDLHWTNRHQGRRFPYYVRVYQGMLSFTAILLVLFFPLFWYSTFGPQVHAGQVAAWTSEVAFGSLSALPFYSADALLSRTTFGAAAATTIGGAAPNPTDLLRFASASDTWQFVQSPQCSSQMWSYTPAALSQLMHELRSGKQQEQKRQVYLVLRSRVTRNRATEALYTTCSLDESYALPPSSALALMRVLESWQAADSSGTGTALSPATVSLPSFYNPYVVSSGLTVSSMGSAGLAKVDCTLKIHRVGQYRGFTCLECVSPTEEASRASALSSSSSSSQAASTQRDDPAQQPGHALVYVVSSADVTTVQSSLSLIPNVGIVALYTSFVLVISTYIRNFFAGDAHSIVLLQLANPEPVAELLRYIYLMRSSASNGQVGDLLLEQLLFLELLDLLRSPERLLALSGRRTDDYAREEYREDLYAVTRRPFDLWR